MQDSLRAYRIAFVIVILLAGMAGALFALIQSIPAAVAVPVLAACLAEIAFYLAAGFREVRRFLERTFDPVRLAALFALSAVVPYLLYAIPRGQFRPESLVLLLGAVCLAAFWHVVLPRHPATDLAFVALMATPVLLKGFGLAYTSPLPRLHLEILGQLMWIRLGILSVLCLRGFEPAGGFRFWPDRKEWKIGLEEFVLFLPLGLALGYWLGVLRVRQGVDWERAALYAVPFFFGMLWVVALSEEFFFRGLLQRWIGEWTGSPRAGLVIAAVLFGLVHLPFRGFPNWGFVAVATVAGLFYGRAYSRAQGIRAAMVAHALTNTVWRLLL